jgi:hypothetical protein
MRSKRKSLVLAANGNGLETLTAAIDGKRIKI